MTAPSPVAAAAPCTALELATPPALQAPRNRPDASVFLVTTASRDRDQHQYDREDQERPV